MTGSQPPKTKSPQGDPTPLRSRWLFGSIGVGVALVAVAVAFSAWPISRGYRVPPAPVGSVEPSGELEGSPIAELEIEPPRAAPSPTAPGQILGERSRQLPILTVAPRVTNFGAAPTRKPRTPDPDPSNSHFIVVDGASGAVLFQQNAFEPIAPASLTKIMTAVLAIETGDMAETVKVTVDAGAFPESSVMGLTVDSEWSLQDLLYGLMLVSGNDAAVAIARHLAGSERAFARKMNEKAAWLGLGSSHFSNPHGFDADDHYSSPADMVILARYAMQYPLFRRVVATRSYDLHDPYEPYTLHNVNGILNAFPGADGVKTGDTPRAGRSLVASAVRDGHRVYVAFMRSSDGAVADGSHLLEWAFDSHIWPPGGPMAPFQ